MKPSTEVRPIVKSESHSPTIAPNRHRLIESITTIDMPNLRKLMSTKKKMMTSEIPSPLKIGGRVSMSNSYSPPISDVTPSGSTTSLRRMSSMRESICRALVPRLRSADTDRQRTPLRWTIRLSLQAGVTRAIWRRGTLTEGTGEAICVS